MNNNTYYYYKKNKNTNKKTSFLESKYDKVVNNVLGLFKKNNKNKFLSTSSALCNDVHEQILSSRLFLDLCFLIIHIITTFI